MCGDNHCPVVAHGHSHSLCTGTEPIAWAWHHDSVQYTAVIAGHRKCQANSYVFCSVKTSFVQLFLYVNFKKFECLKTWWVFCILLLWFIAGEVLIYVLALWFIAPLLDFHDVELLLDFHDLLTSVSICDWKLVVAICSSDFSMPFLLSWRCNGWIRGWDCTSNVLYVIRWNYYPFWLLVWGTFYFAVYTYALYIVFAKKEMMFV